LLLAVFALGIAGVVVGVYSSKAHSALVGTVRDSLHHNLVEANGSASIVADKIFRAGHLWVNEKATVQSDGTKAGPTWRYDDPTSGNLGTITVTACEPNSIAPAAVTKMYMNGDEPSLGDCPSPRSRATTSIALQGNDRSDWFMVMDAKTAGRTATGSTAMQGVEGRLRLRLPRPSFGPPGNPTENAPKGTPTVVTTDDVKVAFTARNARRCQVISRKFANPSLPAMTAFNSGDVPPAATVTVPASAEENIYVVCQGSNDASNKPQTNSPDDPSTGNVGKWTINRVCWASGGPAHPAYLLMNGSQKASCDMKISGGVYPENSGKPDPACAAYMAAKPAGQDFADCGAKRRLDGSVDAASVVAKNGKKTLKLAAAAEFLPFYSVRSGGNRSSMPECTCINVSKGGGAFQAAASKLHYTVGDGTPEFDFNAFAAALAKQKAQQGAGKKQPSKS
jgi:hypothetical protein